MSATAISNFQRPAAISWQQPSAVVVALSPEKDRARIDQAVIRATVRREEVEFLCSEGLGVAMPLPKILKARPDRWFEIVALAHRLGLRSYLPAWSRLRYWVATKVFGK